MQSLNQVEIVYKGTCPKCGKRMTERKSKNGKIYYSCEDFEKCKFMSWDEPTGKTCPECGEHLIVKTIKDKTTIKCSNKDCKFNTIKKGEWIDLHASQTISFEKPYATVLTKSRTRIDVEFKYINIPLGIGMQLPEGYEAIIAPRSSTFKTFGLIQANSLGIIDSSYRGPKDEWSFPAIALNTNIIQEGSRVCQFRIQLSQKATILQKIKWLFTNKIEFEFVDDYEGENRGGFGSTGVK
jgi:dUTP pyrophosphatase